MGAEVSKGLMAPSRPLHPFIDIDCLADCSCNGRSDSFSFLLHTALLIGIASRLPAVLFGPPVISLYGVHLFCLLCR
ncbi:MAG: hypothetical protein B6D68_02975 [spirochete symbiont of Stewartia floridana]|nr:MAG: hypothetical protein B6D68_02975 [spirochete symbiont of Stewartia floridana]